MKKEKDKDGNTILKMEKADGSVSEIKITPDREVYMDGKKMEEGRQMKFGWNDYAFSVKDALTVAFCTTAPAKLAEKYLPK